MPLKKPLACNADLPALSVLLFSTPCPSTLPSQPRPFFSCCCLLHGGYFSKGAPTIPLHFTRTPYFPLFIAIQVQFTPRSPPITLPFPSRFSRALVFPLIHTPEFLTGQPSLLPTTLRERSYDLRGGACSGSPPPLPPPKRHYPLITLFAASYHKKGLFCMVPIPPLVLRTFPPFTPSSPVQGGREIAVTSFAFF